MEIWKPLIYEELDYTGIYEVSNKGRLKKFFHIKKDGTAIPIEEKEQIVNTSIKSWDLGRMIKHTIIPDYVSVRLYHFDKNKNVPLHRLIATTFIANPEDKPQVNHKNGNKANNNVYNLEWVTPQENVKHAYEFGLNGSNEKEKKKIKKDILKDYLVING